ncbi:MAG: hypothetical protein AAFQ87_06340 [Bacteroidota bacterium]
MEEEKTLRLSLQTDLLAYTTPGGWSAWASAHYDRYKLSVAYVNYPNRFRDISEETGIQENPQWIRIQLSQQFRPEAKLRNFFYGLNLEHHWRELTEVDNPDEILNDTQWQLGLFAGYEWVPWRNKENASRNISIIPWLGLNGIPNNENLSRVFENTGSVYNIPSPVRSTIGINISYTFFQR